MLGLLQPGDANARFGVELVNTLELATWLCF